MADYVEAGRSPGARSDPGERGRLRVADRVVERVAAYAAAEVQGIATIGSTLEAAVGRRYPKANADVAGDRVRVTVEVATVWPTVLSVAADEVRRTVRERLEGYLGLQVDGVDVHAGKVIYGKAETRQRRVR